MGSFTTVPIGTIFGLLFIATCIFILFCSCIALKRRQQQLINHQLNYLAVVVGKQNQIRPSVGDSMSAYPTVSFSSSDQSTTLDFNFPSTESAGFHNRRLYQEAISIQNNIYAEEQPFTYQFPSQSTASAPNPINIYNHENPPAYKDIINRF